MAAACATVPADDLAFALLGDDPAATRYSHEHADALAALLESGQLRDSLPAVAAAIANSYTTRPALQTAARLPSDVLDMLAADDAAHRRAVAAGARSLRAVQARRLVDDGDATVRSELAANEAAPADVLARLTADPRKQVRQAAVSNPSTPADAVARCLTDRAADVVVAARSGLLHRAADGHLDAAAALADEQVGALLSCHDGHPFRSRTVPHRLQVLQAAVALGGDPAAVVAALFDRSPRQTSLADLAG